MATNAALGEFEYLVILSVLQLGADAHAMDIRTRIQEGARRSVSRGALYATLDRLEKKGFLTWEVEDSTPERGGIPRRCFRVTDGGLHAARASYRAITVLSKGLAQCLGE